MHVVPGILNIRLQCIRFGSGFDKNKSYFVVDKRSSQYEGSHLIVFENYSKT